MLENMYDLCICWQGGMSESDFEHASSCDMDTSVSIASSVLEAVSICILKP